MPRLNCCIDVARSGSLIAAHIRHRKRTCPSAGPSRPGTDTTKPQLRRWIFIRSGNPFTWIIATGCNARRSIREVREKLNAKHDTQGWVGFGALWR